MPGPSFLSLLHVPPEPRQPVLNSALAGKGGLFMGASSIITMQAKRLAWSLQGTNAQGFWDTVEDTHPSSCLGMEGGRQGLYTPIPTSHSLAEGCSPMLLSASALQHSDLLCTQDKWAPIIRGDFQQGPEPRAPGSSFLYMVPGALRATGPWDVDARESLASLFQQQNSPRQGLRSSLPLGVFASG